jgi:hypothetical protein
VRKTVRGLGLTFAISFINLAGLMLALTALGGPGDWSGGRFVGLFGVLEAGWGLAALWAPNFWRLPVVVSPYRDEEPQEISRRTVLAVHWMALGKLAAGAGLMAYAAVDQGVSVQSFGLLPLVGAVALWVLAVSALIARAGVARPDLDVVQIVFHRAGQRHALIPVSVGASIFQAFLSLWTVVALSLPVRSLFQPEFAPSGALLAVVGVVALAFGAAALAVWKPYLSGEEQVPPERVTIP